MAHIKNRNEFGHINYLVLITSIVTVGGLHIYSNKIK